MPRFYETTLSITNLHNLSISTHVNRSRIYTKRGVATRGVEGIRIAIFAGEALRTYSAGPLLFRIRPGLSGLS